MRSSNQEPREGFIAVGRVARPWGLRGDLKVESLTDFPDRFATGARLFLAGREHEVEGARWQKGALYLKLSAIDDATAAEAFRNELLEVPESSLHPLAPDEFYNHQLVGLRVHTNDGRDLGAVAEVLPTGGNAVLVVRGPAGELLLPFIDEVITDVRIAEGSLTASLIVGLEPAPPRRAARRAN